MAKPATTASASTSFEDAKWPEQLHYWSITRLRRPGVFFTWTISGFDITNDYNDFLCSSKFSLNGPAGPRAFQLLLNRNYKNIHIQCKNVTLRSENSKYLNPNEGSITFEVSVLDARGCKDITRKAQFDSWQCGEVKQFTNFINNATLAERCQELLLNGNLTLLCQVRLSVDDRTETRIVGGSVGNGFSYGSRLMSKYRTLLESGRLSDVELHVGDVTMRAHKFVLAAHSAVFDAMFAADMRESRTNVVVIDDIEAPVFRAFLNFLYTGKLEKEWGKKGLKREEEKELERGNIKEEGERGEGEEGERGEGEEGDVTSQDRLFDLHAAADKYEVEPLKELCEEMLMRRLSVPRVVDTLMAARSRGGMGRLETHALLFMEVLIDQVMETRQFRELERHQPGVAAEILRAVVKGRGRFNAEN